MITRLAHAGDQNEVSSFYSCVNEAFEQFTEGTEKNRVPTCRLKTDMHVVVHQLTHNAAQKFWPAPVEATQSRCVLQAVTAELTVSPVASAGAAGTRRALTIARRERQTYELQRIGLYHQKPVFMFLQCPVAKFICRNGVKHSLFSLKFLQLG